MSQTLQETIAQFEQDMIKAMRELTPQLGSTRMAASALGGAFASIIIALALEDDGTGS